MRRDNQLTTLADSLFERLHKTLTQVRVKVRVRLVDENKRMSDSGSQNATHDDERLPFATRQLLYPMDAGARSLNSELFRILSRQREQLLRRDDRVHRLQESVPIGTSLRRLRFFSSFVWQGRGDTKRPSETLELLVVQSAVVLNSAPWLGRLLQSNQLTELAQIDRVRPRRKKSALSRKVDHVEAWLCLDEVGVGEGVVEDCQLRRAASPHPGRGVMVKREHNIFRNFSRSPAAGTAERVERLSLLDTKPSMDVYLGLALGIGWWYESGPRRENARKQFALARAIAACQSHEGGWGKDGGSIDHSADV